MALRVTAATAIAAAFGVDQPLAAAVLIIPALDLAGILPLTPGNVGVASAAVAFALKAHGVGSDVAVSAGIALGAVETLTTLALGSRQHPLLPRPPHRRSPLAYGGGGDDGLLRARRRVRRDRARPARLAPDHAQRRQRARPQPRPSSAEQMRRPRWRRRSGHSPSNGTEQRSASGSRRCAGGTRASRRARIPSRDHAADVRIRRTTANRRRSDSLLQRSPDDERPAATVCRTICTRSRSCRQCRHGSRRF